jgi:hypothetical protein
VDERQGKPPEPPKRILFGQWGGGYSEEVLSEDRRVADPPWPQELVPLPPLPVRVVGRTVLSREGGGGIG